MKILLVNPPFRKYKKQYEPIWRLNETVPSIWGVRAGSRWPHHFPAGKGYCPFPFFMAYATSMLKKEFPNDKVFLYDAIALKHSYLQFYNNAKNMKPDIIIQEVHQPSFTIDRIIAEQLKKTLNCKIIWTGPYPTVKPELIDLPFIDAICRGEYDLNILDAINSDGIHDYKTVEDIDSLPYPERNDVPLEQYSDHFASDGRINGLQIQLWGSRSCPYKCRFCIRPPVMFNNKLRLRKPKFILEEVKYLVEKYKPNALYWDDDTFNIGNERIQEICRGLIPILKGKITWACMARADTSSDETFKLMAEAGCNAIKFGVESPNQETIDLLNKKLDIKTVIYATKLCQNLGMWVHLTFMYGIPGTDIKKEIEDIKNFIRKVKPNSWQISDLRGYEGTCFGDISSIQYIYPWEV